MANAKQSQMVKAWGIGPDDTGIVNRITAVITAHGGNIVRLRSMQLADKFAVALVAIFSDGEAPAQSSIDALNDTPTHGFPLTAVLIEGYERTREGSPHVFTVTGPDRMGILELVTRHFLRRHLNLEAVTADIIAYEPHTGRPTFKSLFYTTIPIGFDVDDFKREIQDDTNRIELIIESMPLP